MTFEQLQQSLADWGTVFIGGVSVGFSFCMVVWAGMYSARAVTEFLRVR